MNKPLEIYNEYREGVNFKASLGIRGMFEQNKINERFYIGDQWYGAKCGNDRPLVRHNVIKRIGDYKMSQILGSPISVTFSAEGIPTGGYAENETDKKVNAVMSALGDYYNVTAERLNLNILEEKLLKNAFVTGTGVLYTYWDNEIRTGLYQDSLKRAVKGDIACEVLSIDNVYFGDPYLGDLQKQPFIIIASCRELEEVLREARRYGADISTLKTIEKESADKKITVLTKLYKEYKEDGSYTIKSVKVTERAVVREDFDTGLRLYPLAIFNWENKGNLAYGESEITYLIPNQIAINRMITANVWSAMTTGMPIMVVNGDTVPDGITNEPGQIIKVFGSNEDVAGAVKYITPPDFSKSFDTSAQALIENTLTQSGANEVALGDSRADNATALITMRDAALMPLTLLKTRFYSFVGEISRIWAEFWITYYGNRPLKLSDKNGTNYIDFEANDYRKYIINAKTEVGTGTVYSEREAVNTLITLFEKGILNREEFIKRLPDGVVANKDELLKNDSNGGQQNDGL